MSIQYAGGTNVNTTFTTTCGTRRKIVDNVAAKLVNAGWSYISGRNTGDVLLESAARSSAANEICVRIQDFGSGKTMLAKRLPGIQPPLDFSEALETTQVHSVAGTLAPNAGLLHERRFRARTTRSPTSAFSAAASASRAPAR